MTEEEGSWSSVGSAGEEGRMTTASNTTLSDRMIEIPDSSSPEVVEENSDTDTYSRRVQLLEENMESSFKSRLLEGNLKEALDKVSLLEDVIKSTIVLDKLLDAPPKKVCFLVVENAIKSLLVASKVLEMPDLRHKVVTFAKKLNDSKPSTTVWLLAINDRCGNDLKDGSLEKLLMSNIRESPIEMLLSDGGGKMWSGLLCRDRIIKIIKDKKMDANELTMFKILTVWVKSYRDYGSDCKAEERLIVAKELMDERSIDLSSIDPAVLFSDTIRKSGFVSDRLIVDALKKQSLHTGPSSEETW
eukprot:CAMPEP_0113459928 /NCGR_PEP_ID=MMETSP0014_2-20120614/10718_1 /TAXON_ID=2857 /ORGANISM="Nitzschia sp." /LENGTH=301 /DNA_ID=CAMNT_0000351553 /DNA_START=21 /DNA_END=923 /DNA_ORIENTATION=+ /assembly_acc=CAM_ASM_000159